MKKFFQISQIKLECNIALCNVPCLEEYYSKKQISNGSCSFIHKIKSMQNAYTYDASLGVYANKHKQKRKKKLALMLCAYKIHRIQRVKCLSHQHKKQTCNLILYTIPFVLSTKQGSYKNLLFIELRSTDWKVKSLTTSPTHWCLTN